MPEEFGLGGIDMGGEGTESGSDAVSEAAQQRARDDTAKAKQVRTQIQHTQQQNTQFALMLSILLQHIHDESILAMVFRQLVELKVPTPAIFAQFLPYLRTRVDIQQYETLYGSLRQQMPQTLQVSSLVHRLATVRKASQALQSISGDVYLSFVLDYLQWTKLIDLATMEAEKQDALRASVKKELG